MKLLLFLGVLVGGYLYVLLHTSSIVLNQTSQLHAMYQKVGNSDPYWLATGRPSH